MSYADICQYIEEISPELARRADEQDEARRLPADLAVVMAQAGLFRLLTPRKYGGCELTPQEFGTALQKLARANASAAWCTMIADTAALVAAWLPEPVARAIFADPDVILAGIYAPMGRAVPEDDKYRLTGRWPWGSGSANCHWLSAGALVMEDGKPRLQPDGRPEVRLMLVPRADIELIDTWHATGLKGTGSGDIAVNDVVVPADRTVSIASEPPRLTQPLYKFPVFGLLALGIAAVAIGNARAALDAIIEYCANRKAPGGKPASHRQANQIDVAKLEAEWLAARAFLEDATGRCWDAACRSGNLSTEQRANLRLACTHAVRTSADVCRGAYDLGGGSSVFLSSDLQRRFRDAHTMTQHIMVAPGMYEQTGRVILGVDGDTSML